MKNMDSYYMELLKKQIGQLKALLEKGNVDYSSSAYINILSGMIIKINIIIEETMADFHSNEFNDLVSSVYHLRQLLTHYHELSDIGEVESSCKDIIEEFEKRYKSEKEFYKKILAYQNSEEVNVVVRKDKDMYYDENSHSYVFKNDNVSVVISNESVTRVKNLKKGKVVAYIIKCDRPANCFYTDENGELTYVKLIDEKEIKMFYESNFKVLAKDYCAHKDLIKDALKALYIDSKEDGVMYTHIKEVGDKKDKEVVSMLITKILDQYFNDNSVYSHFLKKREFTRTPVVSKSSNCIDFLRLKDNCKEDLLANINKKDLFFIQRSISLFNNLNAQIIKNNNLHDTQKEVMVLALLIRWVDNTIKHMSEGFINANKNFKKIYDKLIEYRNFYAHNIQQFRYRDDYTLSPFFELAYGYVSIINSLEIERIGVDEEKRNVKFIAIEGEVDDFVNCKYGQYVQINPTTFLGNKLFYSIRGNKKDSLVGLVPIDKEYPLKWSYYTLKNNTLVSRNFKRSKKEKAGIPNCSSRVKVKFDVNCNDLLYVYAACENAIEELPAKNIENASKPKSLLFKASEENNYQAHAVSLVDVLADYYQQRYLPLELVKETRLEISCNKKGKMNFSIVDKNGEEIATIIDTRSLRSTKINTVNDKFNLRKTIKEYRG